MKRDGLREWRAMVLAGVCVLGWLTPWNYALHLDGSGPNAHVWGVLSVALSKAGVVGIGAAFEVVLGVGIAVAAAGATLRTWGSAKGGAAAGYAGNVLHVLALALLMPVSGAVFAAVVTAAVAWMLRGEEAVGWRRAVVGEIYAWGVVASFAVVGWQYNADLLVRCVLVCAGVGLVLRGAMGRGEVRG